MNKLDKELKKLIKEETFSKRHPIIYASNLCLEEFNSDKFNRRCSMIFMLGLLLLGVSVLI